MNEIDIHRQQMPVILVSENLELRINGEGPRLNKVTLMVDIEIGRFGNIRDRRQLPLGAHVNVLEADGEEVIKCFAAVDNDLIPWPLRNELSNRDA